VLDPAAAKRLIIRALRLNYGSIRLCKAPLRLYQEFSLCLIEPAAEKR
jgi:hypothetical protein